MEWYYALGDLDWRIKASRRFVSISWGTCYYIQGPVHWQKKRYLRFCRRSCRGPYMFNICCFYATWVVLMLVCISWFTARTIGFQNGDRPRYWIVKFSRNFCQKFKLSLISTSTCKFWAPKNEKVGRGHPLPIPHPPRRLDTRSFGALTPPFVSKKHWNVIYSTWHMHCNDHQFFRTRHISLLLTNFNCIRLQSVFKQMKTKHSVFFGQ